MNALTKEIETLINRINNDWMNDRIENLDQYFHKQVVMIVPGTYKKITGREAMVDSYRGFTEEADVSDFQISDLQIDVFGDSAIALYTFRIKYRVETTNYDESGLEILVLKHYDERWKIVWRNQQPDIEV